ncbi:MAG: TlpA family protein disulfide reductase [Nitrospinae bacterium]|nr:TlpA family protein disulfide reductase [Nitrospinota bacterium]
MKLRFIATSIILILLLIISGGVGISSAEKEEKIAAQDFALMTLDKKKLSLKDFRGKYVFLNFWATWCGPCIDEMPSMERLYQKFKSRKNFVMLAVSIDKGGHELVKRFVAENKLTFTVLLDRDSEVATVYGVMGIPSTYLIDADGFIINRAVGARDWSSKDSLKFFEMLLEGK